MASAKRQRRHHFPRPPGGRPEQKARQAEGRRARIRRRGVSSNAWFMICRMVRVSACLDAAARRRPMTLLSPSRPSPVGAGHRLHTTHSNPPPCSSMLGTQRSPLPSPPLEPPSPLPPPSHVKLWGRPPLASPPHTLFCDISLLLLAAPPDIWDRLRFGFLGTCETDPSHVVARCDVVDIRRCQRSRPTTTRLRRVRCGWRLEIAVRVNATGKARLFSHHEGSQPGRGERRRHAQPRGAPPPPPPGVLAASHVLDAASAARFS